MVSPLTNEILMKVIHKERELEVERLRLGRQGDPVRVAHEKHLFQWQSAKKAMKAVSNNIKHKMNKWRRKTCRSSS